MGACVSSTSNSKSGKAVAAGSSTIRRSSTTAKVVHIDGRVQEFRQPIQVKNIISQNPNCFLCSSESMSIGTCVPQVPDDEELQPGQIYFLLPLSQSHKPLSLPDLCSLAIKASSGLRKDSVDLSSSNSKLILRSEITRRLEVGEEKWVLEMMQMLSAGAGILLHKGSDACGYKYLRGQFEQIVGSDDSEAYHLADPCLDKS